MKKRILSTLLALCMVLTLLPMSAFAEGKTIVTSGECGAQGNNLTWQLDSEGVLTISGQGEMKDFVPGAGGIGSDAPWDSRKTEITTVKINSGATSIGEYAFYHYDKLCDIDIPGSVERIGQFAFQNCSGLKEVSIPDSVTSIETGAFGGCISLTSVNISKNITSIERGVFSGCTSLIDITIPDGVTSIEDYAFLDCISLDSVVIPGSVTTIGEMAFIDCRNLRSVILSDGLQSIGETAFYGCSALTKIDMPHTVTTIGTDAFCGCASLTSVTIPSSVVNLGSGVFRCCDQLENAVFEEGVPYIGEMIFDNCDKLASVSIPSSVTTIGFAAFADCSSLTRITIPSGVKKIDEIPFWWCKGLTEIIVDKDNTAYTSVDGVLFTKDLTTLVAYPIGNTQTSYAIPDCVSEIGYSAFYFCTNLTSINVPSSLTAVGCDATSACWNLKDVYYAGTREQWEEIQFLDHPTGDHYTSDVLRNATLHCIDDPQSIPSVGYTLTGTITGHKDVIYTLVTAQLVGLNGSSYPAEVGVGVTDKTGKTEYAYTASAPAGQYTLEVEARTDQGGVVNRTAVVKLTDNGQTKDINLPNGQAKVRVENKSKTAALVGGLDELIIDADGEVTGEVTLTIENADKSSPGAAAIQSAASSQTLEFMDISITKSENGVENAVTDTGDATVEVVLAFDSTGKSNIVVYRYHDGNVDTLTMQTSGDGEKIEVDDDSIAIYAKKFSVYAIGYAVSPADPATPSKPTSSPSYSSSDSNSDPIYSISVPTRATGGTVKVAPTSASAGNKVTITAKPDSGYELGTVTVADKNGNEIPTTDTGDGKYTFIMPRSEVDVKVEFVRQQTALSFTDVQSGAYFADAVAWAVEKGITAGTSATTFSPDASCTRAQIVTFLWRAAGSPKASVSSPFTDVPVDSYYYEAVLWAVEQGITSGTSATTFDPGATCTRVHAVTFLYRYEKSPAVSGGNAFTDVIADAYYSNAVQWAVGKNVTVGTSATTFSPNATCTRGQIVTFLYRDMA